MIDITKDFSIEEIYKEESPNKTIKIHLYEIIKRIKTNTFIFS